METASLIIKVDSSGAHRATGDLDKLSRAAGGAERAASSMGKAWGTAIGLIGSAAVVGATTAFLRQADAFANMNAKLKLVTGSTQAATKAQRDLFQLSQATSSELETTTDLYVKLGQSSAALAKDHERLLGVTERVSKALVISGADAASSAAVIRQFSQALASGALRGDEFVSVMEGAPRLAKAIADGLEVPIGSLRKMAAEGELTSEKVIKALEEQGAVIDREFGEMPLTVGRATQQVRNALQQLIGDTDKASGASADLAKSIQNLARVLESSETKSAFAAIVGGIADVTGALVSGISWWVKWGEARRIAMNQGDISGETDTGAQKRLDEISNRLAYLNSRKQKAWVNGGVFDEEIASLTTEQDSIIGQLRTRRRDEANTASAAKAWERAQSILRPPGSSTPKATGGGSSVATTKARTAATKELTEAEKAYREVMEVNALLDEQVDDFRRDAIQTEYERAIAVERGIAATEGLISDMEFELSLMGMTNAEREKAILLRHADANATDEQIARLGKLADAYEQARATDELKQDLKGLFVDIGMDINNAGDALDNFFDRLKQRALEALADGLLNKLFSNSGQQTATGGNFWAGLISAVAGAFGGGGGWGGIAKGGAFGGGRKIEQFAMGGVFDSPQMFQHGGRLGVLGEAGPEAIMPLTRGRDGKLGVRAETQAQQQEPQTIKVIAVFGEDEAKRMVTETMKSPAGERVVVTHFQRNKKVM